MVPQCLRCRRSRRGAALVETAVILSLLLTLLLGILEFGRVVMLRHVITSAAREGARLAVVGTASSPQITTQGIRDHINQFLAGCSLRNLEVSIYQADPASGVELGSWDQADYGEAIAVKVEGDYSPVLPTTLGILPDPFHMEAVAMMRSEAN